MQSPRDLANHKGCPYRFSRCADVNRSPLRFLADRCRLIAAFFFAVIATTESYIHPDGLSEMFVFLDNITFRYKGTKTPVLDGLTLFVRSGEIVAIVGEAGAGKTTLLRYVGKRSDRQGGVHIGSDGYEDETSPGIIRGWRFSGVSTLSRPSGGRKDGGGCGSGAMRFRTWRWTDPTANLPAIYPSTRTTPP